MRPVKLALIGAHGTGKTTLSRELTARLCEMGINVQPLPEVPRILCERAQDATYFRRGSNSPLRQCLILLGQVIFEIESLVRDADVVIGDRSLLDHWAYTLHLFQGDADFTSARNLFQSLILEHCLSYDLLFYVPIEFAVIDDGTREDDVNFQRAIDQEILGLLRQGNLGYSTVTGSIEQRTEACVTRILHTLNNRKKEDRTCT